MEKKRFLTVFFSVALAISASTAYAQQSNFSVTPPPLASPSFERGQKDIKFGIVGVSVEGEGFELTGGGVNIVPRHAFTDHVAGNLQLGLSALSGETAIGTFKSDLSFMNMQFGLNLELQPVKAKMASLIFFGGPLLNLGLGSVDYSYSLFGKTYTDTMNITTTMFGVQGGAQVGIKLGPFHLDPFAMISSQSGTTTVDTSFTSTSSDIPSFTTTSYGADIVFLPWNLTLSSMLQQAAKAGDNEESDTTVVMLSFSKKF
ncbi:MAG: hypothetical protein Q8J64_02140 [Thermodesulfovibrionales bacterium]|nr:hypothetical protein [Thermodesulfovibrionales bacterium]